MFGNKEFHLGVEGDPGLGVGLGDLNEGVKAAGHEEYLEAGEELPGGSSIRLGNLSGQDGCPALFSVEVCGVGGEGNRDAASIVRLRSLVRRSPFRAGLPPMAPTASRIVTVVLAMSKCITPSLLGLHDFLVVAEFSGVIDGDLGSRERLGGDEEQPLASREGFLGGGARDELRYGQGLGGRRGKRGGRGSAEGGLVWYGGK